MSMNAPEIDFAAAQQHECPNVRKGLKLLQALKNAVNQQSDGWAYWKAPRDACEKLEALLQTVGNLNYPTHRTITDAQLKAAITPIRRMVTVQREKQKKYGNKFDFDVDAVLNPPKPAADGTPNVALKVLESENGMPTRIVVLKNGGVAFEITRTAATDNDVSQESPRERPMTWGDYRDLASLFGIR